jgi:hypothetical protein
MLLMKTNCNETQGGKNVVLCDQNWKCNYLISWDNYTVSALL